MLTQYTMLSSPYRYSIMQQMYTMQLKSVAINEQPALTTNEM